MENTAVATELTVEQLEALLSKKRREENELKRSKRQAYEDTREDVLQSLMSGANGLSIALYEFKKKAFDELEALYKIMQEYGDIPAHSKGGFSVTSKDGARRCVYAYRTVSDFDERAQMAEEHLSLFIQSHFKAKDEDAYKWIRTLLEKNANGKLELSRAQLLYKMENDYEDPNWKKGIELLKESYRQIDTRYTMTFQEKNELGEWDEIPLSLTRV
ncbi:Protein of unknown function [Pseudarcicella hirudinis]|uniref:DUF3164 family protein n=1 Tax=Pseudarcicella hirudinis TaxID=1079859 RepID=A0A1I5MYE0_9BACT|nr:DUF3164 family protein [Pseudarcicella hirudinis]SFP14564.1 Protein of unknown function [Pseudarcicella hirudinis]